MLRAIHLADPSTPDLMAVPHVGIYDDPKSVYRKYEAAVRKRYAELIVSPAEVCRHRGDYILAFSLTDMADLLDLEYLIGGRLGGVYIFSNSPAYDDEQQVDLVRLWNWTQRLGLTLVGLTPRRDGAGQVVAMDVQPGFHASGHAGGDELREFVCRVAPKRLLPIHTQAAHLWPAMLAGQSIQILPPQYAQPIAFLFFSAAPRFSLWHISTNSFLGRPKQPPLPPTTNNPQRPKFIMYDLRGGERGSYIQLPPPACPSPSSSKFASLGGKIMEAPGARGNRQKSGEKFGKEGTFWGCRRQTARAHGRRRVQARRAWADLPEIHLRRLRGSPHQARCREGRRPGRPRRIPRGQHLLGAARSALVVSARPRQRPAHRQAARQRHGRHRARQPLAQRRPAQELRPPALEQATVGRSDRPDCDHRPRRQGEPFEGHPRARLRVFPRRNSPAPKARKAGSSTRPAASSNCSSRCSPPTKAACSTPAAVRAACSCNRSGS